MRSIVLVAAMVFGGCSSSPTRPAPSPAAAPGSAPAHAGTTTDLPMSDPAEYTIDRISRDAGKAIFARTGVGDPYRTGVPYPIFLGLLSGYPKLFGANTRELADKFGFVARAPDPKSDDPDVRAGLPLGMHLTIDPITNVPFVVNNCALCHAERVTWAGGEATIVGLGNKRVRVHAYDAAYAELAGIATVDKLSRLAREAADANKLTWPESYREAFVGATLAALTKRAAERKELIERTHDGPPGRVAVIESFALTLHQLTNAHVAYAPNVGWAKVPDVIGFGSRVTLSWDGSGQGPMDLLAVEADVAAGVRVAWLVRHPFQGASLGAYLRQPEARPKFPRPIDRSLAERGKKLFDDNCSHCHGHYGSDGRAIDYDEQVVPLADVGTDPTRAQAATESFERAANDPALTLGYTKFTRTFGYVPPVLTNVWMRAPYGHAGQWPSLAVMATPPAKRATRIVVDLDAPYDLVDVGVATREANGPVSGHAYLHDAASPGMSVAGHSFLADLAGRDRAAVIEYLKSL